MKKASRDRGLIILLLVVLVCLSMNAFAPESHKIQADSFYRVALDNYNAGNCINASDDAKKALNYYLMDGDTDGAMKTTDLIGKIKDCLKKAGDLYYQQALTQYNSGKWDESITWVNSAQPQYEAIPDNVSVQKCISLRADAEEQIRKDAEARADRAYQEGKKFYESEDLVNAKNKANEALGLYQQISNAEKISLAQALLQAIDNKIFELTDLADRKIGFATELFKKAMDSKNFEQFMEVKKNAEEAKALYQKAGNSAGYNTSSELLDACKKELSKLEEVVKLMAEKKVDDGQNEYLRGQGSRDEAEKLMYYNNATEAYNSALDLYNMLTDWAKERYDNIKQNYYRAEATKCRNKLEEIVEEIKKMNETRKAEELYKDANMFFTSGRCRNASTSATESKKIFSKINNQAGVFKCETLLYQIDDCVKKLENAESHMANATAYYFVADYVNATNETDRAFEIYSDVKNEEGKDNATNFKKRINAGIQNKTEADKFMAKAEIDFEKNRFDESKQEAIKAMNIYMNINYSSGVNNSKDLIEKNNKRIDEISKEAWRNMAIMAGAIVLALAAVVFSGYSKRIKKEKEEMIRLEQEERARAESEERKRNAEKIAEEQRARELESERVRLKEMIADEMKKVEQEKREKGQA